MSQPARAHEKNTSNPSRLIYKSRRGLQAILKYTILILFMFLTLGPVVWVWMNSVRTNREIMVNPLGLPTNPAWSNFVNAWIEGNFGRYFLNSLIITIPVVLGVLFLSALGGYGLWRFKFGGNRIIFFTFLLGLMVPFQTIMIPLYFKLRDWGLISTFWGVILTSIAFGLPFGIFLMRAFFSGMLTELADAGLVDGCNEFGVFWYVMLPLTKPAFTALGVFQFMWTWNNFIIPYLYLQRENLRTLPLGLMLFSGRYATNYELMFAGIAIATLPIVIVYILLQRQVTEGLTAGALKG